jgi:1-acyl-sn-glycerol-3-phosphate acyltransferase
MADSSVPCLGDAVPRRGNRFSAFAGRLVLRILGWGFEGAVPNVSKAVIIVAPHTSNWDFLIGVAALFALGLRAIFLGKHTLFKGPLGVVMRWLGGIPVDRRTARGVVDETVELFAGTEQLILALSPEGTRGSVDRWRTGFYYVALEARVPIVPVAFDYSRRLIRFGERFDPTGDLERDLRRLEKFFFGIEGRRRK